MKNTTLFIKHMVCDRCIRVVKDDIEQLGFKVMAIELGKVEVAGALSVLSKKKIEKVLRDGGFELINDKHQQWIEKVKTLLIEDIHQGPNKPETLNYSDYLARELGVNYAQLSKLFSTSEGITIEKYIILQKIERVKELLVYNERSLSEIAYDLGYSSVAHLSGQFKKVTGMTPTAFKKISPAKRKSLDQLN